MAKEVIFELRGINGQLRVYEDKVVISRRGLRPLLFHGIKPDKTIPMKEILGIKVEPGSLLNNGYFQVLLPGNEKPCGVFAALRHENTILVNNRPKNNEAMEVVRKKVLQLMEKSHDIE